VALKTLLTVGLLARLVPNTPSGSFHSRKSAAEGSGVADELLETEYQLLHTSYAVLES
jgi:hypothetical protein